MLTTPIIWTGRRVPRNLMSGLSLHQVVLSQSKWPVLFSCKRVLFIYILSNERKQGGFMRKKLFQNVRREYHKPLWAVQLEEFLITFVLVPSHLPDRFVASSTQFTRMVVLHDRKHALRGKPAAMDESLPSSLQCPSHRVCLDMPGLDEHCQSRESRYPVLSSLTVESRSAWL